MSSSTATRWMVVAPRRKTPEQIDRNNWKGWRMVSIWLTKEEAEAACIRSNGERVRVRRQKIRVLPRRRRRKG